MSAFRTFAGKVMRYMASVYSLCVVIFTEIGLKLAPASSTEKLLLAPIGVTVL